MQNDLSVSIPVELLLPHVIPVFQKSLEQWLDAQPQPDQQYTAEQVSNILNIDVQTVHDYTRLEVGHPRRLPYVVTHDSAKGKRFLLSEVNSWQQRNRSDVLKQHVTLPTSRRPARRRA
ncbi:hypothetical protein [Hymenobacter daeguensis]